MCNARSPPSILMLKRCSRWPPRERHLLRNSCPRSSNRPSRSRAGCRPQSFQGGRKPPMPPPRAWSIFARRLSRHGGQLQATRFSGSPSRPPAQSRPSRLGPWPASVLPATALRSVRRGGAPDGARSMGTAPRAVAVPLQPYPLFGRCDWLRAGAGSVRTLRTPVHCFPALALGRFWTVVTRMSASASVSWCAPGYTAGDHS